MNNYEQELKQKYPTARWFKDGFDVSEAKQSGETGEVTPSIVQKPWGFEVWLAYTNFYAHKILIVLPKQRLSLQKHHQKTETWLIEKGEPLLTIAEKTFPAKPGHLFHIATGTVHRITAQEEAIEIREISTPELGDVERIEDDFDRA